MSEATTEAPEEGGPPWIQPEIQRRMAWRDGDIVISVPAKSGTTWTMNIVHQMLTGGDTNFEDVYAEVPWIEFVARPDEPIDDIARRLDAMPANRRRAFKSHSAPPDLPYFEPGGSKQVKYIVVCRNPEEAVVSFRPFIERHTDAWFDLWDMPREAMVRSRFPEFYSEIIDAKGMQGMFFGFVAAWWPLRHQSNVLFLHFSDMKRDHAGSLRKIATFLDVHPTPQQWHAIEEYTSFEWMKAHEEKFEAVTLGNFPMLERGAMIRKGQAGEARADGMTEAIARHMREVGGQICQDTTALDWFYEGGTIPR